MVTREEISEAVDQFTAAADDSKNQPDEVEDAFEILLIALRSASGLSSILGGPIATILGQMSIGEIEECKDAILEKLNELLQMLEEAARGIAAPFAFVDYAAEWESIRTTTKESWNEQFANADLSGFWDGVAADRYSVAMGRQAKALESVEGMCKQVSDSLIALAKSGLEFYTQIAAEVVAFLGAFASALTKIASVAGAPWGIADAIDIVTGIGKTLVVVVGETSGMIQDQMVAQMELESAVSAQYGIPGNKWPAATAGEYNNATVSDGVNSWSVQCG